MPKTRKLQLAFSGGEIDPQMYGRIDSPQYQSGLATCKNWMVDPRGTLRRRPGMQRVASSLDSTKKSRLIPFTYSVDQQLAIELTDQKIRFHANGGTVVWADFKEFLRADVSTSDDTITFAQPHGFQDNEPIVFYAKDDGGGGDPFLALPSPFSDPDDSYYVQVVDSKTIKVLDGVGGSLIDILTSGSTGYRFYVFKRGTVDGYIGPARIFKQWSRNSNPNVSFSLWRSQGGASQFCLNFTQPPSFTPVNTLTTYKFYQGERVELVYDDGTPDGAKLPGIPHPLWVDYYGGPIGTTVPCTNFRFGLRTKKEYVETTASGAPNTWVNDTEIIAASNLPAVAGKNIFIRQYHEAGDLVYIPSASWIPSTAQHKVLRFSGDVGSVHNQLTLWNTYIGPVSDPVSSDGSFSITSPFLENELFDIEYDQSGDVVTFTHPSHPPQDLKRLAALDWRLAAINFSPTINAPTGPSGIVDRGQVFTITDYDSSRPATPTTLFKIDNGVGFHPFAIGDTVYVRVSTPGGSTHGLTASGYYTVSETAATGGVSSQFALRNSNGSLITGTGSGTTSGLFVYYSVASAETTNTYKVTALNERSQESLASAEVELVDNVLSVPGSSNEISWTAVPEAKTYNVYKQQNGLFGFIGQVEAEVSQLTYTFTDDNIGPDFSQTLPIQDTEVEDSFHPRASARFEQRRCFGGSDALPRTLFMSRTGTESSFSYRFPVQSDDRISVDLASREAHVIRHIVPVQDLLMMTQQGEFRVTAINSDAITPNTIAIRQQSYVGSNNVHPQVVNNSVVFCSARGGHAREMNFRVESQGYLTGDLSLRAAHLFDGFTLNDLAYSKAPTPVLWFVSSSGKLLCLTYIPEERVLAWHQHETGGTVESVCSISEGDYDNLYVIVKRGSDRSVERLVQVREEALEDAVYLDASVSKDGTNTSTNRFNILSSGLYQQGDTVTVTAMEPDSTTAKAGLFSSADVGGVLEFTLDGSKYRVSIDTYVSATQFTGKLLSDLPSGLRNTPTSSWAFAYKTFTGYKHLVGQTVTVLADGVRQESVTVAAVLDPVTQKTIDGSVTLSTHAVKICGGLPYVSQAKTLPMSLEVEAGAQGRTKNVNQVFVRVEDTGALSVGMDEADLKSVTELSNLLLKTGEFRTSVPSTWDDEGQIVVEATGAAPANLLNITTQVSIGD